MKSPEDDVAMAVTGTVAVAVPGSVAVPVPGSVAVTVPGSSSAGGVSMIDQPKQGGKCCGSCCDYRRAVIILSSISIILTIITLARGEQEVDVEDDDLAKQFTAIQDDYSTSSLILNICSLIMALVSIVGAIQFNQHMVGLAVLYVLINFILSVVFGSKAVNEILEVLNESDYGIEDDILAPTEADQESVERAVRYVALLSYVIVGFITAFWIYPSVMLITEIRSKIMTRETYPREEFSCCCVGR
jgi:Ca2+/Na+ antiporter